MGRSSLALCESVGRRGQVCPEHHWNEKNKARGTYFASNWLKIAQQKLPEDPNGPKSEPNALLGVHRARKDAFNEKCNTSHAKTMILGPRRLHEALKIFPRGFQEPAEGFTRTR